MPPRRASGRGDALRTNYVLIDFENVQPAELEALDLDYFRVILFVGANQTRLPYAVAEAVQKLGSKAEYVKISGSGPNALDFHIAFYIGRIASGDETAFFHIISKDTGYDPLIRHLSAKKIGARRVVEVSEIPLIKAANCRSVGQRLDMVLARLNQLNGAKPRTLKTLKNMVQALFQKKLAESDVKKILDALQSKGVIKVDADSRLAYAAPSES